MGKTKITIGPGRDTSRLWLHRRNSKATDGGPRVSGVQVVGLVDGDGWRVTEGLPMKERHRRLQDIMCHCGFAKCSKRGPCAPAVESGYIKTSRRNLILYRDRKGTFSAVCDRCGWQSGLCTTEAGLLALYDAKHACPAGRILKQDIMRDAYRCTDCEWRSGTHDKGVSQDRFDAHRCKNWPAGTVGIGMTCAVHGESPPFPSAGPADRWMAKHANCAAQHRDDEPCAPRPFAVGDWVRSIKYPDDRGVVWKVEDTRVFFGTPERYLWNPPEKLELIK